MERVPCKGRYTGQTGAWAAATTAALLACASGPALAQVQLQPQSQPLLLDQFISPDIPGETTGPGVTVASRQHPDYASPGVRLGEFVLRPDLTESVGFDDNVLGTRQNRGSAVVSTSAAVRLNSDWARNSLGASLTVDDVRYLQQPRQSLTNWSASLGGTYEIGRDTLSASYTHLNLTQTPRDLDVPLLDTALQYRIDSVRLGYRTNFNRLYVQPALDVSLYNYDNGSVGGVAYLQDYRDRVVAMPSVTVGYELAPRRNVVLVVRDGVASYTNKPANTVARDYNDIAVLAGLDYDLTGLLRVRVLGGYEVRTFRSSQITSIQAPIVEASAVWNPTSLVTLNAGVTRRIQDSADETTVGYTETALQATGDYEYLRNVVFRVRAGLYLDDYNQGQGHQTLYTAGAGVTWSLNRNMRVGATYDFTARETSGTGNLGVLQNQRFGSNYSENRYMLQLRLSL